MNNKNKQSIINLLILRERLTNESKQYKNFSYPFTPEGWEREEKRKKTYGKYQKAISQINKTFKEKGYNELISVQEDDFYGW